MKTIVLPTDFSEPAGVALYYAEQLATLHGCNLELIHVNTLIPEPNLSPDAVIALLETQKKQAEKIMKELLQPLKDKGISCSGQVANGLLIGNDVIKFTQKKKADLVVISTTGTKNLIDKFIGSNANFLISNLSCPVLVVPNGSVTKPIKNIVFASELHIDELNNFNKLASLAEKLKAKVTLLNVSCNKETDNSLLNALNITSVDEKYTIVNVQAGDVVSGLSKHLASKETDLLVMTTHKRQWFESLYKPSLSKKMTKSLQIPILVYQE